MILRCGSCSAKLRLNDDHVRGRSSAPCPKCGQVVHLRASAQPESGNEPTITISCGSCHATLRAAASRAGARSRCPKCRAEVVISAPAPAMSTPPQAEDSSGASTRRIDSRSLGLGMMRPQVPGGIPGGIDVDEFLGKSSESAATTPGAGEGHGAATSILKPPIEPMREAAEGIREAAVEMAGRTSVAAQPPAARSAVKPEPDPMPQPPVRKPEPAARPGGGRRSAERSFPSSRGFISGALAGALAGGALAYAVEPATTAGLSWLVATMPAVPVPQLETLPAPALRALLVSLLGGLSGFVAEAIGAPRMGRNPLRLIRCGSIGLLAGAAAGAVITLAASGGPEGISFWPLVNWMRDLLLVGLLTPAVHRLLPGSRS